MMINLFADSASLSAANPTLTAGQVGLETDTLRRKTGDGTTAWAELIYDDDKFLRNAGSQTFSGDLTVAAGAEGTEGRVEANVLRAIVLKLIEQLSAEFSLRILSQEEEDHPFTADRTLRIVVGDADRKLTLLGDLVVPPLPTTGGVVSLVYNPATGESAWQD